VRKYGDELFIYAMAMQAASNTYDAEEDEEQVEKRDIKLTRNPIYSGKRFRIEDTW